ncbi:MAG: glycerate kinase [bacterium]|nr:glycerate kinase [bacterium]
MKLPPDCRFLLVPDSFKGTLDSMEVAEAIANGLGESFPDAHFDKCPMADGGEGSSVILGQILGARRYELDVVSADHRHIRGFYFMTDAGEAFVEIAAASGLPSVREPSLYAVRATSFGTGQLIADAITRGARKVHLFLGGSATSDGGVGIAKALGYRFVFEDGSFSSSPVMGDKYPGEQLSRIVNILPPEDAKFLRDVEFVAVCDVENPLYGVNGAAHIYGPQKGANAADVELLDQGLAHLSTVVRKSFGKVCEDIPGAGAAGGAGYATLAFLDGQLRKGADFLLEAVDFDRKLLEADCVITGEGQIDDQSIGGKLFSALLKRSAAAGKPLIVIAGVTAISEEMLEAYPNLTVFGLGRTDCFSHPDRALRFVARNIGKLLVG